MIWRGTHLRPLSQGPEHANGVTGGTLNSPAALKAQLRTQQRRVRAALPKSKRRVAALRAAQHALRSPRLRRARDVAVYLAVGSELDTAALITALRRAGKMLWVPFIERGKSGRMRMTPLPPVTTLRPGPFRIPQPTRVVHRSMRGVAMLLLPLIAYDARGTRLGSGAGYYDRWLHAHAPRPFCLGYALACQEVAELPNEPWDQRLDAICTEHGVRRFRRD